MQEKMSLDARRELLERVSERYRFARVGEKTQILNQFLATTGLQSQTRYQSSERAPS